ncbi:MAG: hypothetical protein SVV03_01995 [Candidatus Nanohaloarchaea archaeon]|nr:hypothetical protein [Candidatus Nanohaloarchaea archaeon]
MEFSKGQAAIEYLAMVSIALFIAAPLVIQTQQTSFELKNSFRSSLTKNALNNLEEAASLVNSQGEPAKVSIDIRLPEDIKQTNVTENYFHVAREVEGGRLAHFYNVMDFNVSGSIPNSQGKHTMVVEAWNEQVNVSAK